MSRHLSWTRLALLLVALPPANLWLVAAAGAASERSPHAAKVFLIGLDGADWRIIDPMIARGELPHLARLKREGVWGQLKSAEPLLSPLIWTTIATGKTPDQHGILGFRAADPETGEEVPVTSNLRRVKALWQIAGSPEGGAARVGFVGWLASWPAEEVNGFVVSDRLGYHSFAYQGEPELANTRNTYPEALFEEILPHHRKPTDIDYERAARFIGVSRAEFDSATAQGYQRDQPVQNLRLLLATADSYRGIGTSLIRKYRPDLFGIFFELIDSAGHLFMHYSPPRREGVSEAEFQRFGSAMSEIYRYQDQILGELLALADEKTAVIVVSDHGFKSAERRPRRSPNMTQPAAAAWHEIYGVFLAWGYGIAEPVQLRGATIVDIAPTVLALLGSPVPDDMPGRVLEGALDANFLAKVPPLQIASYEGDDTPGMSSTPIPSPFDRAMLQRLEALGYLSESGRAAGGGDGRAQHASRRASELRMLAMIHAQKDEYERAAELLRSSLELDPNNPAARADLATALMEMGRDAEAKAMFERVLELGLDLPEVNNNLGQLLRKQGDFEGAIAAFKRALAVEPNHTQFRVNLGDLYRVMGDLELAELELARAVRFGPDSARARNNYGAVLIQLKRFDDALSQFEAVVALDPTYALSHHNIGYIQLQRGRPKLAEAALRRAAELGYAPSSRLLVHLRRTQAREAETGEIPTPSPSGTTSPP